MAISAKQSHTKIRLKPTFPVRQFSPFQKHSHSPSERHLHYIYAEGVS